MHLPPLLEPGYHILPKRLTDGKKDQHIQIAVGEGVNKNNEIKGQNIIGVLRPCY